MMENIQNHIIYIYIYRYTHIKQFEILLNMCITSLYNYKICCPYCNQVVHNDIPFEEHYDTKGTCNIELPN